mgnify:CR=1 FL=1
MAQQAVAICGASSLEYIALFIGILRAGLAVTPLHLVRAIASIAPSLASTRSPATPAFSAKVVHTEQIGLHA